MFVALIAGCSAMTPGKLNAVSAETERDRAGNVFLLRGFIGIFSTGIDSLGEQINDTGVEAQVFQDDQWKSLAATVGERYRDRVDPEPLILIGHSYGADDVVRIARELDKYNVKVDLLITLDPVTPPAVTKNVVRAYNLYQTNGAWDSLPWLRGVELAKVEGSSGIVENVNIRKDRPDLLEPGMDHFNIEKKKSIHQEIMKQILATCPPREQWTARQRNVQPTSPDLVSRDPKHTSVQPVIADVGNEVIREPRPNPQR
jgi:pimeloyl-ACP methyl ester carboxylesterase